MRWTTWRAISARLLEEEGGKAFKLGKPNTQRTGGKKKMTKRLTSSCSVV